MRYESVESAVKNLLPEKPLHVYRPAAIERAAQFFISKFSANLNSKIMFAVKTNPEPIVLQELYQQGIRSFDVASLAEVELVRGMFPDVSIYFMHTVKSRRAIREAYFTHGVRDFSLDSDDELAKILTETGHAKDLNLYVRLAIPNNYAELNLSGKFGVALDLAPELLRKTRKVANRLGVCFHVGSQCMHPDAYRLAIRMAQRVIREGGVEVDALDVGGGFPSIYPGMHPPALAEYFDAIHEETKSMVEKGCQLMCEPGRALVAESGSVITRVELRKGSHLYLNDGTYGSLFDAGFPQFVYPVRALRITGECAANALPFSFFGPTCDTLDYMKGPFFLPEDIAEGDYIEIGQLGAYSRSLVTNFNGFSPTEEIILVDDDPLMSMYNKTRQPQSAESLAA